MNTRKSYIFTFHNLEQVFVFTLAAPLLLPPLPPFLLLSCSLSSGLWSKVEMVLLPQWDRQLLYYGCPVYYHFTEDRHQDSNLMLYWQRESEWGIGERESERERERESEEEK